MPKIDVSPQTLPHAIVRQVRIQPGKQALVFLAVDGKACAFSYAQLNADAQKAAHSLLTQGIEPGDLLILAFDHGYPLVAAFLGAMYVGAVPSIFPYYSPDSTPKVYQGRVQHLVEQSKARAVMTQASFAAELSVLMTDSNSPVPVIGHDTLGNHVPDGFAIHQARPSDLAYLQFSSGSTGLPRGATICHQAVLNNIAAISTGCAFGSRDVSVGWLPLYHDLGLVTQILLPLVLGAQSVILSPQAWLRRPATLMRAVQRYRASMSWMPNFGFAHSARQIRDADMCGVDLSSWRTVGCGGEPVQFDSLREFSERFVPYGLCRRVLTVGYGMAENTVGATSTPHDEEIKVDQISQSILQSEMRAQPVTSPDDDPVDAVSCGTPLDGTEVSIVDVQDDPLPERCVGEIRIRGNSLFDGYFRQPEETAQSLRNGWFYTGDLGYLADGQLYVVGREKDLVIAAGQNLYPHHIEKVVQSAAGKSTRRVVAFGVPDDRLATELPVAVVEVRGRMEEVEQEQMLARIRKRAREEMGVSLADVRLVGTGWIEVTTSGKLARRANRQKYLATGWRPPSTEITPIQDGAAQSLDELQAALVHAVATVTGVRQIDPNASLVDMGIDSLAMVQILLLIEERLGRQVQVEQFAIQPTIDHLARLLHGATAEASQVSHPASQTAPYPALQRNGQRQPLRQRLLQRGPILRRHALPYRAGTRVLRSVVSRARPRQALYRPELELLRRCLEAIPVQAEAECVIQQSLMVNSWAGWRRYALANDGAFGRWVEVKGIDVLDRLAAENRGVVLVFPHTELKKLVRGLPVLRGKELAVIGNVGAGTLAAHGMPHLANAVAEGTALSKTAVRSAQLVHAVRKLRSGGRVIVLADDDDGTGGIRVPFHGRLRPFRPGAAELAVRSDAAFVPMFASMDVAGHVVFEFLEPLSPEGGSHSRRIRSLLHQYACCLAQRYTTDLGAMEWYILRKFLRYPKVA